MTPSMKNVAEIYFIFFGATFGGSLVKNQSSILKSVQK